MGGGGGKRMGSASLVMGGKVLWEGRSADDGKEGR
jgi:hypothetical protein